MIPRIRLGLDKLSASVLTPSILRKAHSLEGTARTLHDLRSLLGTVPVFAKISREGDFELVRDVPGVRAMIQVSLGWMDGIDAVIKGLERQNVPYGLTWNRPVVPFRSRSELKSAFPSLDGNFKHLQICGNFLEREGLDGNLWYWKEEGLEVSVARPLTGFDEEGSWRFADSEFPEGYASKRDGLLEYLTPPEKSPSDVVEAALWMRNLITNLDQDMSQFSSIVHWENACSRDVLPLINSAFEEMDGETIEKLTQFLMAYGDAVRESGGVGARNHLLKKRLLPSDFDESIPFAKSAIEFVLKNKPANTVVVVNARTLEQVESWTTW